MPDEFHSPLRCARAKEQMEPSQRDHEPHRPETSRLLGQDHTKLPHGQVVVLFLFPSFFLIIELNYSILEDSWNWTNFLIRVETKLVEFSNRVKLKNFWPNFLIIFQRSFIFSIEFPSKSSFPISIGIEIGPIF